MEMAKANFNDDVCEWQLTKNTVGERIKYLYRNPLMADVHFIVADKEGSSLAKVTIPSHRFILAVSSPVFFAMFYGKLQEPSEYIDLPDCDSEGFLEFLRYIYCDEVKLTGSCVIQVLYLAKKYMIPSLTSQCTSFLEANINAENVLDVFPAVEKMEEAHLIGVCWKFIDTQTKNILQSAPDSFLEDNDRLVSILKRDTLDVNEVDVFQAVNRWAESICTKRGITPSGKEKRTIIGDTILKLIRFPLMPQNVFAEHVTDTNVLTETEVIQMFMYFSLNRNPGEFSCIPRWLNSRTVWRCKRYTNIPVFGIPEWFLYSDEFTEIASFTVNVPIVLGGIRLLGSRGHKYTVQLKLNGKVILDDSILTEQKTPLGSLFGFDIIFDQYYLLNPDVPCLLEALIKGPRHGSAIKKKGDVVHGNVTFRFIDTEDNREALNGSRGKFIQIAEILFRNLGNN